MQFAIDSQARALREFNSTHSGNVTFAMRNFCSNVECSAAAACSRVELMSPKNFVYFHSPASAREFQLPTSWRRVKSVETNYSRMLPSIMDLRTHNKYEIEISRANMKRKWEKKSSLRESDEIWLHFFDSTVTSTRIKSRHDDSVHECLAGYHRCGNWTIFSPFHGLYRSGEPDKSDWRTRHDSKSEGITSLSRCEWETDWGYWME